MIVLSRFLGKFNTDCWFALLVLLFFLELLKKKKKSSENDQKKKKKSSENDQLTGQSFLIYFFHPLDPKSEKQFP